MTDREEVRSLLARSFAEVGPDKLKRLADALGIPPKDFYEAWLGFEARIADALLAPAASGTEPDAWGLRDKTTRKVVVARAGRDAVYDALRNMGGADGHLDTLPVPLYLTAPAAPTPEQVERVLLALSYGQHSEGCPRALAALNDCTCGWSEARSAALGVEP